MTTTRILVVDDDADLRRLLSLRLRSVGHEVHTADDGADALSQVPRLQPDLVITDVRMDKLDGMSLFDQLRKRWPTLPVIILTAHGTIPDAIEATRRGVFAYLTKPFESQALLGCVADAMRLSHGEASGDEAPAEWREGIVTRSPVMEEVLRKAKLVASSGAALFIHGESGTGKELIARAVHKAGARRNAPFVAINCAAVPDALLESELFGHVRGAFTGATTDHSGLFVAAHGGTLFLDEVGDMPLSFQAKLLRVLEAREVRPLGGTKPIPIDVRVISASHADLEAEAREGRFREDLLYRLDVVNLELPPLSARPEDVPLLAQAFLDGLAARADGPAERFAPEAMALLVAARWPGNVRQLRNVVERCVALAPGPVISSELVEAALRERRGELPTLEQVRADAERDYLVQLLQVTGGNVSQASRVAGRNRTEFYKLLGRHALDPAHYRDD